MAAFTMSALVCRVLHTGPGHVRGRLAWLVYRRWMYAARRLWVRLTPCGEHEPYTRPIGRLVDFLTDGPSVHLQTVCGRCRVVLRDWSA
jgi:hypothetical protein